MTQKYLNAVCKPKSLVFMFLSKKCQISEFTAGGDRSLQFEGIFNALIIDLTSEFFLTMDCTIFAMFSFVSSPNFSSSTQKIINFIVIF